MTYLFIFLSLVLFWILMQKRMGETFRALLEKYREQGNLDLEAKNKSMETTLGPIREMIKELEIHTRELEKRREGAYASLFKQIEGMVGAEKELRNETKLLSQALRSPNIRGSWGQLHLKRVVELAGLINHCDFYEQKSVEIEGKSQRPDLVIQLPGHRQIVVDAKTPLEAYLSGIDSQDEAVQKRKREEHAMHLRKHIKELSQKEYWKQFERAPEYVILFLPAEAFFSSALEVDPNLIENAANQNIIIATPTTLIAILRAVAFSWKQEILSKNTMEIAKMGEELYERIGLLVEHWNRVGKHLNTAVEAYNQSLASLETRVLVTARKLKENGSFSQEIEKKEPIEKRAKEALITLE